ncbi:unnamed protein product [Ectocarpus fasciculatus]
MYTAHGRAAQADATNARGGARINLGHIQSRFPFVQYLQHGAPATAPNIPPPNKIVLHKGLKNGRRPGGPPQQQSWRVDLSSIILGLPTIFRVAEHTTPSLTRDTHDGNGPTRNFSQLVSA